MECQYVATQRGGIALVFEGHRYNKVRDGKDGTVYWRCSRDRQCPGRAVTVNNRVKKANNKHNHPAEAGIGGVPGATGSGGSVGLLRNGSTTTAAANFLNNSHGSSNNNSTSNHHSHHGHHSHHHSHHHSSSNRHHHLHNSNQSNSTNHNNSNNNSASGNHNNNSSSTNVNNINRDALQSSLSSLHASVQASQHHHHHQHHTSGSSSSAGLSPSSVSGPSLLSEVTPIISPRVPSGLTIQEVLNAQTAAAATAAVSFPTLMQETLKYIAFASGNHQIASFAASMANFGCPNIETLERSLCRNMFTNEGLNAHLTFS